MVHAFRTCWLLKKDVESMVASVSVVRSHTELNAIAGINVGLMVLLRIPPLIWM